MTGKHCGLCKRDFISSKALNAHSKIHRADYKHRDLRVDHLFKAVQEYVTHNGGSVIVIGGIQIQEWPQDGAMTYHVAIKCTGRKPSFANAKAAEEGK